VSAARCAPRPAGIRQFARNARQAAGGFDYRFAGSPWHVSGQFRYSEGKANGAASIASSAVLPGGTINYAESIASTNKESHWLADAAVGRDVAGDGPDSLQLKFGLRIGEWVGKNTRNHTSTIVSTFTPPVVFGGTLISQTSQTTTDLDDQRASYIGVGPRVGIEGEIPVAGGWAFNYLADVAVLFGNQRLVDVTSQTVIITPDVSGGSGGTAPFRSTSELFSPAVSADLQAGVSYWVQPNVKLTASYRIDALTLFNTHANTNNYLPDRYTHGPHLGVSATF
jgi:Legionella pneumophila major outer membrane protein precursor